MFSNLNKYFYLESNSMKIYFHKIYQKHALMHISEPRVDSTLMKPYY